MRIAVDTNRYTDFSRGEAKTLEMFERAERIFMPFVTMAELRAGFLRGTKSEENERNLQEFLNRKGVEILYADEQTTHHYARLYLQLCKQGTLIPTNDLWIAALVVQHDLLLCARHALRSPAAVAASLNASPPEARNSLFPLIKERSRRLLRSTI